MANYRTLGTDFSAGLRAPHYTNGRLLTAEDLQQEQQTTLERLAQTGRAAGYGIVEGFQVTAVTNKTALRVTAGLGLNRKGNVIQLAAEQVTLPVQPVSSDPSPIRRASRFEACIDEDGDQPVTTADGAYLLTVAPLAQLEGSVPRKACDGTGTPTCANQWEVEGVSFKIIRLVGYNPPTGNRANRNRNLLAHWFYGSAELLTLMRDPLQFAANYTGFSQIAAEDFSLCDLPLAVFFWADKKITFIDQWAVRRRLIHPYSTTAWAANLSDQRLAEGQARFLQFQEHIADLQATFGDKTDTIRAVDRFAYLPPVGILPVNPFELIVRDVFEANLSKEQQALIKELGLTESQVLDRVRTTVLDTLGSSSAYNLEKFFGQFLPPQYSIVHEDFIHDRLHQSWVQPPIALPPPTTKAGLFDLQLIDGTLLAVNDDNFTGVLTNISNKFTGSVFNFSAAEVAAITNPPIGVSPTEPGTIATPAPSPTRPGVLAPLAAAPGAEFAMLALNRRFQPPREIFDPRRGDDGRVEPLVEIMVVDELLDPYRDQLARDMSGRIDDAITALSGIGGIFTGLNRYTAVNTAIANAFTLNTFLTKGSLLGWLDFGQLFELIQKANLPIFYVVFARHRPPVVNRPLRL